MRKTSALYLPEQVFPHSPHLSVLPSPAFHPILQLDNDLNSMLKQGDMHMGVFKSDRALYHFLHEKILTVQSAVPPLRQDSDLPYGHGWV